MDFSNVSKKLIKVTIIVFIILLVLVLFFWIMSLLKGKKISYSKIEEKMVSATKLYLKENENLLPIDGDEITVSFDTLVKEAKLKELSKYTSKNVSCSGEVVVKNNSNYYSYIPFLDCGSEYKTETLVDHILTNDDIVNSDEGLYFIGNEYIYRGEYVKNFVNFGGQIFRILKIDSEGNLKVIQDETKNKYVWDDRYNIGKGSNIGINDYEVSRVALELSDLYDKTFTDDDKSSIISKDLCIGKRFLKDTTKDGSTECSEKLENQKVGLIQANEFLIASIDENCKETDSVACQNYNYLATYDRRWWTITPVAGTSSDIYEITPTTLEDRHASGTKVLRMVIYLDKNVIYKSGDGSYDDPYIIG